MSSSESPVSIISSMMAIFWRFFGGFLGIFWFGCSGNSGFSSARLCFRQPAPPKRPVKMAAQVEISTKSLRLPNFRTLQDWFWSQNVRWIFIVGRITNLASLSWCRLTFHQFFSRKFFTYLERVYYVQRSQIHKQRWQEEVDFLTTFKR